MEPKQIVLGMSYLITRIESLVDAAIRYAAEHDGRLSTAFLVVLDMSDLSVIEMKSLRAYEFLAEQRLAGNLIWKDIPAEEQ